MLEQEKQAQVIPEKEGCVQQIGEMDGSMIPIVTTNEESEDKRKNKTLEAVCKPQIYSKRRNKIAIMEI